MVGVGSPHTFPFQPVSAEQREAHLVGHCWWAIVFACAGWLAVGGGLYSMVEQGWANDTIGRDHRLLEGWYFFRMIAGFSLGAVFFAISMVLARKGERVMADRYQSLLMLAHLLNVGLLILLSILSDICF
jgi:hypothetical protein